MNVSKHTARNAWFAAGFLFFLLNQLYVVAQVSITNDGTPPHNSAQLEVKSTNKGLLLPRVANPAATVNSPAAGLVLYNTTTQEPNYFNGNSWQAMGGALTTKFPRVIAFQGSISSANEQTNYTWTVPANITQVWIEMWAAGNAGSIIASFTTATETTGASGGDAGDYASLLLDVTPGQQLTLTVGNGGTNSRPAGGNTTIVNNGATYQVLRNYSGLLYNNVTGVQVPGLLQYVDGEKGSRSSHTFVESSAGFFRRVIQTGRGGNSYPNQKGGGGVVLHFNGTTGAIIPSGLSASIGGDGSTPGSGGGGSYGQRSSGGNGMVIVHW